MLQIVLTGLLAMSLIIIVELWQSNKRLNKMLELDKKKMARLFDENIALENKAFNIARQYELECD
jgi:cell division protein FtsB